MAESGGFLYTPRLIPAPVPYPCPTCEVLKIELIILSPKDHFTQVHILLANESCLSDLSSFSSRQITMCKLMISLMNFFCPATIAPICELRPRAWPTPSEKDLTFKLQSQLILFLCLGGPSHVAEAACLLPLFLFAAVRKPRDGVLADRVDFGVDLGDRVGELLDLLEVRSGLAGLGLWARGTFDLQRPAKRHPRAILSTRTTMRAETQ